MDWATLFAKLPDAIPPLVGALVGGSIAVVGGVAIQWLSHVFTRLRDTEKLRREKAEELMQELFVQSDWLLTAQLEFYEVSEDNDKGSVIPLPPADRLRTLQWLYFPELQQPIEELYQARLACVTFFRTHHRKPGSDYMAWAKTHGPTFFDPVRQDYLKAWWIARDAVLAAAESRSPLLRLLRRLRPRNQQSNRPER
jgi:hypothetical protein